MDTLRHNAVILEQLLAEYLEEDRTVPCDIHWRWVHLTEPGLVHDHLARHNIDVRAFHAWEQAGTAGIRVAAPHGEEEIERLRTALATLPPAAHRRWWE